MFFPPAYAQSGGAGAGGFGFEQMLPFLLIFVVFYFLLIRPQQKKAKMHREMVSNLRRGDKVVTAGGLIGKVAKAPEGPEVEVELGEGMKVKVIRETISQVVTKSAPPEGSPPPAANEDNKGGGLLGGLFKR
jgi:preprotein translocase subunit YajC